MTKATARNALGRETLWGPLQANDLAGVEAALAGGADPNAGYGGWIPMGRALRHAPAEIVMALVKAGATLDAREQHRSLVGMTAGREDCVGVLQEMLKRGAPASNGALRVAARAGNTGAVIALLKAGAPLKCSKPDPHNDRDPPLTLWPERQAPAPELLVSNTFAEALDDELAERMTLAIVNDKNMITLVRFMRLAKISEQAKNTVLFHCVQRAWQEGVDHLLETGYCDATKEDPLKSPVLSAMTHWLNEKRRRGAGWKVLDRLIAYGYSPNLLHRQFSLPEQPLKRETPNGFALVRRAGKDIRSKLLRVLATRGMAPVFDTLATPTTVAHLLIDMGEWRLLSQSCRQWPKTCWELPNDGLLAAWALDHPAKAPNAYPTGDGPEESLELMLNVRGLAPGQRDRQGHSALRSVLRRHHPDERLLSSKRAHELPVLDRLVRRLIGLGLNPFTPDEDGVDDIAYASRVGLPGEMVAGWATLALELNTAAVGTGEHRRATRL